MPSIRGLNHLTLAVSDLDRSVRFYSDVLGFEQRARWSAGAYLEAGSLWLCLALSRTALVHRLDDYTHYAFDISAEEFDALSAKVIGAAPLWKPNTSEGRSVYFLGPDGHRLEIHTGTLQSRLDHYRRSGRPVIMTA